MSSIFGALVPPVPLVPVSDLGPVHFIAAGGAGMAPLAELYAGRGVRVSGSDRSDSTNLARLRDRGVTTFVGHAAEQVGDAETVVVSSAIAADNPEVVVARERGLRIWHRSAALGALMEPAAGAERRVGIAVGGTHGKTTTSGMLAHIFWSLGMDPGFVVGAPLATTGEAAADGTGPFVVEADESDGSFLQYPAELRVITNVEADHLDNWKTPEAYAEGFVEFAEKASCVVINIADAGAARIAATVVEQKESSTRIVTVGPGGDWWLEDECLEGFGSRATLHGPAGPIRLALQVPGLHNLHNAAVALVTAVTHGADATRAAEALGGFRGTARRFTPHGEVGGVRVFDDYAHHPTELDVTLRAARVGVGDGRVVACFQPHLYSRTRDFAEEFGEALALADECLITDVFAAREEPIPEVDASLLVDSCRRAGGVARWVPYDEIVASVTEMVGPGDVVLTLGAGDITQMAPRIVEGLRRTRESHGRS